MYKHGKPIKTTAAQRTITNNRHEQSPPEAKCPEAEEKNAEGFAKECAIVTHYRLKNDPNNKGKLIIDPNAKLEEETLFLSFCCSLFFSMWL